VSFLVPCYPPAMLFTASLAQQFATGFLKFTITPEYHKENAQHLDDASKSRPVTWQ